MIKYIVWFGLAYSLVHPVKTDLDPLIEFFGMPELWKGLKGLLGDLGREHETTAWVCLFPESSMNSK